MDHVREGYRHSTLSDNIICCFYTVYNTLGSGFLEKVYKNALFLELQHRNLCAEKEKEIKVYYNRTLVGEYYADLMVEDKIILELKAVTALVAEHEAQLLSYLKATEVEVGLLFKLRPEAGSKEESVRESPQRFCPSKALIR